MVVFFIIFLVIGIGTGFIFGIEYKNPWSKWEDIGVIYNSTEYTWTLLQSRAKENGKKQFRHVSIQKYGNLPTEMVDKINNK